MTDNLPQRLVAKGIGTGLLLVTSRSYVRTSVLQKIVSRFPFRCAGTLRKRWYNDPRWKLHKPAQPSHCAVLSG
jgi:hypothetical protein